MAIRKPAQWDKEVDVVVMGTGGAALTAAILAHDQGAQVLVLEKTAQIGGTTAFSGGVPWIPMNRYMREAGLEDNREDALRYLRRLTGEKVPDPHLLEVFVDNAHKMIDYLYEHTPVRFSVPKDYPDYYYNNVPGGKMGRSLDPVPFELNQVGEWGPKIRQNPTFPPLTLEEGGAIGGIDFAKIAERMEKNIVTMGRALVGMLVKALLDRGVEMWTETPGKELILNDDGEVIGLVAEQNGKKLHIGARKGVVLASGGFEWNQELVRLFLKGHVTHPLSPPGNEGDALIMAMEVGAMLANMGEAWWYPAMQDPTIEYEGRVLNQLGGGRNGPNSIIVNRHGKRFVNEGTTYMDMPKSFYIYDQVRLEWPNEPPVWMIFDQQLKDRTMIITMMPGEEAPEWVNRANTIRELAEQIGVDPDGLEETVNRWNENARKGVDPDFHRGTMYFENLNFGGGNPQANIGTIEKPPFYAVPVYYGTLGTCGGPRINENGQVMNVRGKPISGLYAAGNAAMNVFGQTYPAAGGTIGPAMTFGYLAGMAVGKAPSRAI